MTHKLADWGKAHISSNSVRSATVARHGPPRLPCLPTRPFLILQRLFQGVPKCLFALATFWLHLLSLSLQQVLHCQIVLHQFLIIGVEVRYFPLQKIYCLGRFCSYFLHLGCKELYLFIHSLSYLVGSILWRSELLLFVVSALSALAFLLIGIISPILIHWQI